MANVYQTASLPVSYCVEHILRVDWDTQLWMITSLQITSDGRIVVERDVKARAARQEHRQQTKALVAGAIVNQAAEMEVHWHG